MNLETIRTYCLSKPYATEDLPFGPGTLVFKVGGKMFALLPLDKESDYTINLKCDPEKAVELREQYPDAILPGFHQNKLHWNTVHLEKGLTIGLMQSLIDHSYQLIFDSLSKSVRATLDKEV